jgi:hypothetical protein
MFNRNNYASLKNLPMFVESYSPATYTVNGENMTLSAIISDLDDKQQSYVLLDNQISSFKSTNSAAIMIQGLEAAKLGLQKIIGSYQDVLSKEVSLKDLSELLSYLNEQIDPSLSIQRQINFLKIVIQSKS